jgi:hypothetical protein
VNDTTPFQDAPAHVARTQQRLERLVRRRVERFNTDLETMCEAALADGKHGVLITWSAMEYRMTIDERVPYGQIWEKQT